MLYKLAKMDPYQQTIIVDANARYYGVEMDGLMEKAGESIAHLLIKKYGDRSYAFVCGLGNNGGDGFAAARHLKNNGINNVKVYLVGRKNEIKSSAARKQWDLLKDTDVETQQEVFSKDIEKADVMVECLLGTGGQGKLFKRFHDVIYRLTRLKSKMVTIDVPVAGYTPDYSISIMYPKTADAVIVDLDIPDHVLNHIGPGEVKLLLPPKKFSYKSQNGKVLIIGGSEKYHGAPVLAAEAAANYAGLVYVYSPGGELVHERLRGMSSSSAEFISVYDNDLQSILETVDAILIGPGLESNFVNKSLINTILKDYPHKNYVIDAAAIEMVDKELVRQSGNVVFTPHRGELHDLLPVNAKPVNLEGTLKRYAAEHNCYINLKSSTSILFNKTGEFKFNTAGNAGMAKGGTGDVLAGLTAALICKNDPWIAMTAAAFINGIAGDLAQQDYGFGYSAEEIIKAQQKAYKYCSEF